MSVLFSCLLLPDLAVRHSFGTNSHTDLVSWLGLTDDQTGTRRRFLRAVVPDGDMARYAPDEDDPGCLPTWYAEQAESYRERVAGIVAQALAIEAECDSLGAEYRAKRDPLWAEYDAKSDSLWAEYRAKRAPLWAEYEAKCALLRAEYGAIPGAIRNPAP